ncbi:uncharacterized protein LOC129598789 [Paramacrobiotus metropolitanus]|uniref:uncharacterized protein LOC129598789 n=1 Tax=Paramacrobiotus metropolitanus TaxID=2943436 RepID=UPI002445BAD5|nr:uncharacterized protein LOC129598789 [Paramacrobiotus metropolitanus]
MCEPLQYPHSCNPVCKKRGCGVLYVCDGIWKAHFKHCSFIVQNHISDIPLVNFPSICTEEPIRAKGSKFCPKHAVIAESLGINPTGSSRNDLRSEIPGMQILFQAAHQTSAAKGIELPSNSEASTLPCYKQLGETKTKIDRSRGYLFIVRAGGHVESFAPIYGSESPSQVFLILIAWMYLVLQGVPVEKWGEIFIAYDNMCNLDKIRATKVLLPLPYPYNSLWINGMTKVIDGFHLSNHKSGDCHTKYNPEHIKQIHPNLETSNTQACEQTFSWLGAFQYALFQMPKYHQIFFLHRIVQRRNRYLEKR